MNEKEDSRMYDRHLDTFLEVADSGSFLKASERLYISANAVTKQINLLESDLGVKLFSRSRHTSLSHGAAKGKGVGKQAGIHGQGGCFADESGEYPTRALA